MQIELGCPYYLWTPDSSDYVAFNTPSDPKFVGYVTDITGLDDAEVRENAQNTVAGDGGYHGPFWRGRRPWTISGMVIPVMPVTARSEASRRIGYIMSKALRQDGFLTFLPSDGVWRQLSFRKQQPYRNTTGQSNVQRNFQVAGVSADWRIYSQTQNTVSTSASPWQVTTVNNGDADAPVIFTITGPIDGIIIENLTTGKYFSTGALGGSGIVPAGNSLTVNLVGRYPTAVRSDGANEYGNIVATSTNWDIAATPGSNVWQISSYGNVMPPVAGQSVFKIQWNDAYQ